ncbi:Exocyst complex component 5 [Homalodisca vitripennis]|nr:Exocyst complex component 5 [Homalodisca vitripennis]
MTICWHHCTFKTNLQSTQACSVVVQYMSSIVAHIRDSLDGKNVEYVMCELGCRFHRVIYDHLLQFTYNSAVTQLNDADVHVGGFSLDNGPDVAIDSPEPLYLDYDSDIIPATP